MLIAKYIWSFGATIFLFLGSVHLFYTFFSNKFQPKKPQVQEEMEQTYPQLTKQTTMWRAWIGFNASHSSGAMFIGFLNLYIAYKDFGFLIQDPLLCSINILTVVFYLWLAKTYWFKIPLIGISLTLLCYVGVYAWYCLFGGI